MPLFFISYSRRDRPFVTQFVPRLRNVYGHESVWYDAELKGGVEWAKEIRRKLSESEIFVILLSPDSMQSPHCRAEWEQAFNEGKAILPVLIQDNTRIAPQLASIQYVDMSAGINDLSVDKFHAAVNDIRQDLRSGITPKRNVPPPAAPLAPLTLPLMLGSLLILMAAVFVAASLFWGQINNPNNAPTATPTPTARIAMSTSASPSPPLPTAPANAATATLPILPTRATNSSAAALNVFRSQGGVAFCNVQAAAFALENVTVTFAIGAGESYALTDEFPSVASIAPGTCLCLRNRDVPGTFPQQCSAANSSSTKRSAGDWFNAQMTVTFATQTCVLASGETEKRCF